MNKLTLYRGYVIKTYYNDNGSIIEHTCDLIVKKLKYKEFKGICKAISAYMNEVNK